MTDSNIVRLCLRNSFQKLSQSVWGRHLMSREHVKKRVDVI